jgi:hypothetical protein
MSIFCTIAELEFIERALCISGDVRKRGGRAHSDSVVAPLWERAARLLATARGNNLGGAYVPTTMYNLVHAKPAVSSRGDKRSYSVSFLPPPPRARRGGKSESAEKKAVKAPRKNPAEMGASIEETDYETESDEEAQAAKRQKPEQGPVSLQQAADCETESDQDEETIINRAIAIPVVPIEQRQLPSEIAKQLLQSLGAEFPIDRVARLAKFLSDVKLKNENWRLDALRPSGDWFGLYLFGNSVVRDCLHSAVAVELCLPLAASEPPVVMKVYDPIANPLLPHKCDHPSCNSEAWRQNWQSIRLHSGRDASASSLEIVCQADQRSLMSITVCLNIGQLARELIIRYRATCRTFLTKILNHSLLRRWSWSSLASRCTVCRSSNWLR